MSATQQCVPSLLKALGRARFPDALDLPAGKYRLVRVFKHDFFAATGLFQSDDGRQAVLKIGRISDLMGLPGRWIGRYLARREARIYRALADLEAVPDFLGMWHDCGFVHEFVPGHELQKGEAVGDEFFDQLDALIGSVHGRAMAYVDLEKCENIIVGDDGLPYLIDFQISWHVPGWWGSRFPPSVWLRGLLQEMDRYHLLKHRRRNRPDQLAPEQLDESFNLPGYIRLHRALTRPLQIVRRGLLRRLDPEHATARR